MIRRRLPSAQCQTALALVWLLLCAVAAPAREFTLRTLSDPQGNARLPSIGETGLVAWQGYVTNESAIPGSTRSDIFIWKGDAPQNITSGDTGIAGRSERPFVFRDSIAFLAWFKNEAQGGYPLSLSIPLKSEEMQQMEADYPTLFDPPQSALEAEASTNALAAEAAEVQTTEQPTNSLQRQMRRSSGKGSDIAVYRPDGTIERITPGTRNFNFPVMSEAGIAFQCARGWPYGYEMVAWKPGDTALTQLTTNYFYVMNPDMHGNELVFQGWDGNDYEIFLYRFDTGLLEQITNNQFDDISPVAWNGQVAWIAHPTVAAEVFHYQDGNIRKISEGTEDNAAPAIWEGKVVWQAYDDTDLEIYYFDGRRTIKLTSNTWDDMAPKIRDGLITWMSYVDNWDAEIMALDLGDNTAVQLTNDESEDSFPQTAGEKIVWQTVGPTGSTIQMAEPTQPRPGANP